MSNNVKIIQDINLAIVVMHSVGAWMLESGLQPNQWWQPQNMNRGFLLKHTEPDEYFVALIDNKPAASMVLQETERNQSWKPIDGDKPKQALYVHWLCVAREFAGQGLPKTLIDFALKEAKRRGFSRLRLDTSANEKKLCRLYENLGFKLMGIEEEGSHATAFYQKEL